MDGGLPGWLDRVAGRYIGLRIRHKLLLMLALMGVVIIGAYFVLFRMLLSSYNAKLYQQSTQLLNATAVNIDNELQKIEELSFSVFAEPTVQLQLEKLANGDPAYDEVAMKEEIYRLLHGHPYVLSIDFFDTKGHSFAVGRSTPALMSELPPEQLQEIAETAGALSGRGFWFKNGWHYLVNARMVRKISHYSFDELGVIACTLDIRRVVRNLTASLGGAAPDLVILDGGEVLYQTAVMPGHLAAPGAFSPAGYTIERIAGVEYFITSITSSYNGWQYVSMTPMDAVYSGIQRTELTILTIIVGMVAVLLFVGIRFSHFITRPLEQLQKRMEALQAGDFRHQERDGEVGSDEVAQLSRDFEVMVGNIDDLIYQNYIKQLAVKESQYKMLQTQINPHFLYNTLDSINWMAKAGGQREISEMVEAMATLFRETLNMSERSIPIREELELLDNYLTIQKIRLEGQLEYRLDVAEKAKECLIPKFTLQPLVENAIQHGFDPETGQVCLLISICRRKDWVVCSVEDRGPGMAPDIIARLRSGELVAQSTGIGLRNVDERLDIAFQGEYSFTVECGEGGCGTRVVIRIPVQGQ